MFPQADRTFEATVVEKNKRPAAAATCTDIVPANAGTDVVSRHRAWLQRGNNCKKQGWRPAPRYRVSSRKLLRQMDNMFNVSTHTGGLAYFLRDEEKDAWADKNWRDWPYLGITSDLGSDNVCAFHALEKKLLGNVDLWPDGSHAANRDTWLMLGHVGMKQFWILMMCVWNVPFGPMGDDGWLNTLMEAWEMIKEMTCDKCPLFLEMAPRMIEAFVRAGIMLPGEQSEEQELWNMLLERGPFRRYGSRVNANRFQGSIHAAKQHLQDWHLDLFVRTFVAIELDMLKGKKLAERLTLKAGAAEEVAEGGFQGEVLYTTPPPPLPATTTPTTYTTFF